MRGSNDLANLVQTSCGYAVPMVSSTLDNSKIDEGPRAYLEDRKTLGHWAGQQIEKGVMHEYRQKMNSRSLDGCAGLKVARQQRGEWMLIEDCMIWFKRTTKQWQAMLLGFVIALVTVILIRMATDSLGLRVPRSIRHLA